jgi:hypothetical protein
LHEEERFQEELARFVWYINYLTERIPVWKEIARLPVGQMESSKVSGLRAEGWICLTATGLNLMGRVGHRLFSDPEIKQAWEGKAASLAELDWSRDAEIWQGNIVQQGKKGPRILTQQAPMKLAFEAMSNLLGLPQATKA